MIAGKRRAMPRVMFPEDAKILGDSGSAALEFISDLSKTCLKAARTSPLLAAKDCERG